MNKDWILFHLEEALEEIQNMISEINSDNEYDEIEYKIAITHLYHHINTAWNSRNNSKENIDETNDEKFIKDRQFPTDIDMT